MNKKISFIFLLAAFLLAGSAAFAAEPPEVLWWGLKVDHKDYGAMKSRAEMVAALEKPKTLILRWGEFPLNGYNESAIAKAVKSNKAKVWIRNPEGAVSEVDLDSDNMEVTLPTDIRGLYLIGVRLSAVDMDFDSDGKNELVHFYSKHLVYHFKQGGRIDPKPEVFFKDMADKLPLEIGPLITKKREGGGPFMGGYQTALKEHKMKVFYKGRPLANAEVNILTESGWKKSLRSDSEGMVLITPPETLARAEGQGGMSHPHGKIPTDHPEMEQTGKKHQHIGKEKAKHRGQSHPGGTRGKQDKYLYVVTHKDQSTGEYHCASLLITVRKSRPEWLSRPKGFTLWGIIGAGLGVIGTAGGFYHRKRRDRETILKLKGKNT
ncbi:MAG: hypothetical protein JRI32_04805 [Deltaproteobacteria bacterium]|nr:hypothetical protein [Deltaproteobacteria bacterium]